MEQGRSTATRHSSFAPTDRSSASAAAFDMGSAAASARKQLSYFANDEEGEGEGDGGSAAKLKKEIERMQDRCLRLGALVSRLGAAQQREQKGGGQGEEAHAQLHTEQQYGGEQGRNVVFAAGEVRSSGRCMYRVGLGGRHSHTDLLTHQSRSTTGLHSTHRSE